MLKNSLQKTGPLREHGFMLSIELEEGTITTPEHIRLRLADSVAFLDGIGNVDVTYIGQFDNTTDQNNSAISGQSRLETPPIVVACRCGQIHEGRSAHACPFESDVRNNADFRCNCCEDCEQDCLYDI